MADADEPGNPAVSGETVNAMATAINIMIEDSNGDLVYSNNKALAGYLAASKFLIIPKSVDNLTNAGENYIVSYDLNELGKINGFDFLLGSGADDLRKDSRYIVYGDKTSPFFTKTLAMNFAAMKAAGLDNLNASIIAALRARWVVTGAYTVLKDDKSTNHSEVRVMGEPGDPYEAIETAVSVKGVLEALGPQCKELSDELAKANSGYAWIIKHADNLWAAAEHCFRVRGHHFRNSQAERSSYTALYTRFMEACYEGNFEWPAGIDLFEVFHTAIHPFKMKALPLMTAHYVLHGTIANAAIIRTSGAPNGHALITTAVAGLNTMAGEIWYRSFEKAYAEEIAAIKSYANQILSDKYGYHICARLYGKDPVRELDRADGAGKVAIDTAKQEVSNVAAACQGLINALERVKESGYISSYALSNAKALQKAAGISPFITVRVSTLITKAIESIEEADNITEVISNALPASLTKISDAD